MTKRSTAVRDLDFLHWAKEQGGCCCLCRRLHGITKPSEELHHFGEKGMAQKGSDHIIARLCIACHHEVQGKREIAFARMEGGYEYLAALRADALELLSGYIEALRAPR